MSLNLSHNHLNDHSTERVVARKRCVRRTKMTNNRPERRQSARESERDEIKEKPWLGNFSHDKFIVFILFVL